MEGGRSREKAMEANRRSEKAREGGRCHLLDGVRRRLEHVDLAIEGSRFDLGDLGADRDQSVDEAVELGLLP